MNQLSEMNHAAQAVRRQRDEIVKNLAAFDAAMRRVQDLAIPRELPPAAEFGQVVWTDDLDLEELPLLRDGKATGAFLLGGVTAHLEANFHGDWRVTGFSVVMGGVKGQEPYRLRLAETDFLYPVLKAAVERSCGEEIESRMETYGYRFDRGGNRGNNEHRLGSFELLGRR